MSFKLTSKETILTSYSQRNIFSQFTTCVNIHLKQTTILTRRKTKMYSENFLKRLSFIVKLSFWTCITYYTWDNDRQIIVKTKSKFHLLKHYIAAIIVPIHFFYCVFQILNIILIEKSIAENLLSVGFFFPITMVVTTFFWSFHYTPCIAYYVNIIFIFLHDFAGEFYRKIFFDSF